MVDLRREPSASFWNVIFLKGMSNNLFLVNESRELSFSCSEFKDAQDVQSLIRAAIANVFSCDVSDFLQDILQFLQGPEHVLDESWVFQKLDWMLVESRLRSMVGIELSKVAEKQLQLAELGRSRGGGDVVGISSTDIRFVPVLKASVLSVYARTARLLQTAADMRRSLSTFRASSRGSTRKQVEEVLVPSVPFPSDSSQVAELEVVLRQFPSDWFVLRAKGLLHLARSKLPGSPSTSSVLADAATCARALSRPDSIDLMEALHVAAVRYQSCVGADASDSIERRLEEEGRRYAAVFGKKMEEELEVAERLWGWSQAVFEQATSQCRDGSELQDKLLEIAGKQLRLHLHKMSKDRQSEENVFLEKTKRLKDSDFVTKAGRGGTGSLEANLQDDLSQQKESPCKAKQVAKYRDKGWFADIAAWRSSLEDLANKVFSLNFDLDVPIVRSSALEMHSYLSTRAVLFLLDPSMHSFITAFE
eukprot:34589-Hanusia_phi.AAC.3